MVGMPSSCATSSFTPKPASTLVKTPMGHFSMRCSFVLCLPRGNVAGWRRNSKSQAAKSQEIRGSKFATNSNAESQEAQNEDAQKIRRRFGLAGEGVVLALQTL
jgi:hypothetical protein